MTTTATNRVSEETDHIQDAEDIVWVTPNGSPQLHSIIHWKDWNKNSLNSFAVQIIPVPYNRLSKAIRQRIIRLPM